MSQMLHVTKKVANKFTKDPMCYIFLECCYKIQFNGHINIVTCHMCYMSHIRNVTCHKYKVVNNFTKDPMCYIFLECSCKLQFNGHAKNVIYNMSQMLHVTNIRLPRIKKKTMCLYFWKANSKCSSMVMLKKSHVTYVTCHTCYMSQISS